MAGAGLTHSQLAAKLLVEGCLANIAGNVQGKMPVAPVPLTELERADIGLEQGGNTVFYPVLPTGVFFDMHGAKAMVWFMEADSSQALDAFERAMKAKFSRVKQTKDGAHPTEKGMRTREYVVEFENSRRLAAIQAEYPDRGAPGKKFQVHILAQERR
jgi:hypothetical protein